MVKSLPAMQETWVLSLGQEDPLEKEMATHSSTLAWKIPWTRSLVGYSLWGCKESDTTEQLHLLFWWSSGCWKFEHRIYIISVSTFLSVSAQACPILCNSMDFSPPPSTLSMEFSRQEYWSTFHWMPTLDAIAIQEIFLTQGLNPGLLHCRQTLYHLSHQGRSFKYMSFF